MTAQANGSEQQLESDKDIFNIFLERIMSDALEEHDGKEDRRKNNYQSAVCR